MITLYIDKIPVRALDLEFYKKPVRALVLEFYKRLIRALDLELLLRCQNKKAEHNNKQVVKFKSWRI